MKIYEAKGMLKFTEEDTFNEGCDPKTAQNCFIEQSFSGETSKKCLEKVLDFLGANIDECELNACGEAGRVDVKLLETNEGGKATKGEIELWKQGKKKLYSAIYTVRIESVSREEITL